MKRITVDIPDGTHTELKISATRAGKSISEVVREMIDEHLAGGQEGSRGEGPTR